MRHRSDSGHRSDARTPNLDRIADLLVRCSGVPLASIAAALGFFDLADFCRWFQDRAGEHPESARVEGEPLAGTVPQDAESDGPDEVLLGHLRRALFARSDRRALAPMVRALRRRA